MSKHGDVIEHSVDKLEHALENNVELSYGLRLTNLTKFSSFKNITQH